MWFYDFLEYKKNFKRELLRIISPLLKQNGYKYNSMYEDTLFYYEKMIKNSNITMDFQLKTGDVNVFDFYLDTNGKETESMPDINISWKIKEDEKIETVLEKIKKIIIEKVLPWAETVEPLEIDCKKIILENSENRLKQMGFIFRKDLFENRVAYINKYRKISYIEILRLLPFVRETSVGFDVIRFELPICWPYMRGQLLFYPETKKTPVISFSSFQSKYTGYKDIDSFIRVLESNLDHLETKADVWFNENRPSEKPKIENWGLFPDLDKYPKEKKKIERQLSKLQDVDIKY